jgi:PAS domain S-box-containing protein
MCRFINKINEDQYLKCLEYAKVIMIVVQDMKVQYFNPKQTNFFGYNLKDIEDNSFLKDFISTNSYDIIKENCKLRLDNNFDEQRYSISCYHKSKLPLIIDVISYGVIWNERPASLVFFWDVTQEKKLELDQLHYKYIFENSPRAIDVCNLDGLIIDMNKKSEELWNINREDFINKQNFFELERIRENQNLLNKLHNALETRSIQKLNCYSTYDNSFNPKYVQTEIYPVVDNTNNISHFVILNDDLTAKKKIEEEKEALYTDLLYKNQILEVLSVISNILLECNDPDSLNQVIQLIGETLNVTRSYIYEILEDNTVKCRFEYTNNVKPFKSDNNVNNKTLEEIGIPFSPADLHDKKAIVVNDTSILNRPDFFIKEGIKSFLVFPLFLPNNQFYGYIGYDECRYTRTWRESEISILKNLSNLVGSFIKKCYYEKRLDKYHRSEYYS